MIIITAHHIYSHHYIFILDSYPYQFLPTRDGYVPVYIRVGDTPLNEINPELAVAFHEVAAVNGRQLKSDDEVSN